MARAAAALLALGLAVLGAVGCGEEEGVAEGATVVAYVEAPLCDGVADRVRGVDAAGGSLDLRLACLPDPSSSLGGELSQGVGGSQRIDLATVGANARRATQDSATVAFLQRDDPAVARFTQPILEAAGIALITADSRAEAVQELVGAIGTADPSALRADVLDAVESHLR